MDNKATFKKKGVKRLKAGSLPAKADFKAQREFYEEKLLPLMKRFVASLMSAIREPKRF